MKKLMITIVAAASLALGAWADPVSGTDFETTPLGTLDVGLDDTGSSQGTLFWNCATPSESTVTNQSALFTSKYLSVDQSDVLYRYMKAAGEATEFTAGISVYFSSKVQFTASEETDGTNLLATATDKLLIWLRATEDDVATPDVDESETNLVITAGRLVEGQYVKHDYVCTAQVTADQSYSLVVKAKMNGLVPVFTVTIDNVAVTSADCATAYEFPSMDQGSPDMATIASVGFKGTGAIDDLEFGTTSVVQQICDVAITYSGENISSAMIGETTDEEAPFAFTGVALGTFNLVLGVEDPDVGVVYNGTTYEANEFGSVTIPLDTTAATPGTTFTVVLTDADSGETPDWPATWNGGTQPASMESDFAAWLEAGNDPSAANAEKAFLLGVNLADYEEEFAVASIGFDPETGAVVITGNYPLDQVYGKVFYKAAATPTGLAAATAVAAELDENGAVTITKGNDAAKFYQIVVGYPAE